MMFDSVKVFSATMARDREGLGEKKLTASIADIELLLTDCAVPQAARARVLSALERRGIWAAMTTRRYA